MKYTDVYKSNGLNRNNIVYKERSFSYEQLINYYPKHYLLDELLTSNSEKNHINFFFDLKNIMQTVYLEFAMRYLINDTNDRGFVSPWVFEAFVAFIGFHKDYVISRGKTCSFYVFFETGESGYHKRIYKKYKENRTIDKAFGLSQEEIKLSREIWQKNLLLIEKAGNKLPDVHVIKMTNLEADFIPYYLMSRELVDMSDNVINITYSTDHDLYQNALNTNSYTYYRHRQTFEIFDKYKIIDHFARKKKKFKSNISPEYYPIFIAMCGDTGDDIPVPIRGAGPVRVNKIIEQFVDICGGIEKIYEVASNLNNTYLISENDANNFNSENTYLNKFVRNNEKVLMNIRLMSFEVLSRVLDNSPTMTLLEQKKHIHDIVDKKTIRDKQILIEMLAGIKVYPEEKHIDKVYLHTESTFEEISKTF